MIYTGLLSLLLAEYAANQKCSAVLLCSADSIYPFALITYLNLVSPTVSSKTGNSTVNEKKSQF